MSSEQNSKISQWVKKLVDPIVDPIKSFITKTKENEENQDMPEEKSKSYRLFKVAKDLNISVATAVDHLASKGHTLDQNDPNVKIGQGMYDLLQKEYASDKQSKEKAASAKTARTKAKTGLSSLQTLDFNDSDETTNESPTITAIPGDKPKVSSLKSLLDLDALIADTEPAVNVLRSKTENRILPEIPAPEDKTEKTNDNDKLAFHPESETKTRLTPAVTEFRPTEIEVKSEKIENRVTPVEVESPVIMPVSVETKEIKTVPEAEKIEKSEPTETVSVRPVIETPVAETPSVTQTPVPAEAPAAERVVPTEKVKEKEVTEFKEEVKEVSRPVPADRTGADEPAEKSVKTEQPQVSEKIVTPSETAPPPADKPLNLNVETVTPLTHETNIHLTFNSQITPGTEIPKTETGEKTEKIEVITDSARQPEPVSKDKDKDRDQDKTEAAPDDDKPAIGLKVVGKIDLPEKKKKKLISYQEEKELARKKAEAAKKLTEEPAPAVNEITAEKPVVIAEPASEKIESKSDKSEKEPAKPKTGMGSEKEKIVSKEKDRDKDRPQTGPKSERNDKSEKQLEIPAGTTSTSTSEKEPSKEAIPASAEADAGTGTDEDKKVIRASDHTPKLTGPKIVGRIELPDVRAPKSRAEREKEERLARKKQQEERSAAGGNRNARPGDGSGNAAGNADSESEEARKKRKRKRKSVGAEANAVPQTGNTGGGNNSGSGGGHSGGHQRNNDNRDSSGGGGHHHRGNNSGGHSGGGQGQGGGNNFRRTGGQGQGGGNHSNSGNSNNYRGGGGGNTGGGSGRPQHGNNFGNRSSAGGGSGQTIGSSAGGNFGSNNSGGGGGGFRNENKPAGGGGGDRNKSGGKKDVNKKDVKDKVKSTLFQIGKGAGRKRQTIRKEKRSTRANQRQMEEQERLAMSNVLEVTEFLTANELANLMNVSVNEVIAKCMVLGMIVSINQRINSDVIQLIAEEFGYEVKFMSVEDTYASEVEETDDETLLTHRAPIVTVMGHVDHGKTSLLDYIRKANVIAGEAGGITQHIGAYEVELDDDRRIAFLDTPGHEAFTAMRARGAQITDIAIIVIAADDQVMPQTREAINHAQAAGVPMVFAINKVDKPGAQPEKIKEQLAQMNLLVEDWGGKYQCQEISAKFGKGINELLEKVLLEAEILNLRANVGKNARGTVIEAKLDKGRGVVTTVLVQNGTLKIGDMIIANSYYGRVKAMFDERMKKVKEAGPSTPVLILGLDGVPQAGDKFQVMDSDREARELATKRQQLLREQSIRMHKHITLEEIARRSKLGDFKELNIIVKGDVDGSVEALSDSLIKLSTEEVAVRIIMKGVGQISESDVLLASASNAIIIGFQVRPSPNARKIVQAEGVDVRIYSVIYNAINEIKDALEGLLRPTIEENVVGVAEIRDVFKISKVGTIAGCMMTEGKINRNSQIRVVREGIVQFTGKISSLKRFKDDVKEVADGYECGISVENFNDIKVGDLIEAYEQKEIKRKLE